MGQVNWQQLLDGAGGDFEPLPIGPYDCVVETCEATLSSNKKEMLKAVFKVQTGPHAGRKVFNNFVLSPENPNALAFFFTHMKALGLTAEYFAQQPSMEQVAAALVGRQCRLELGHKVYQGSTRNEVKKVMPSGTPSAPGAMTGGMPPAAGPMTPTGPAPAPQPAPVTPSPVQAPPAPAPAPVPPPPAPPVEQSAPIAQPAPVEQPAPIAPVPPPVTDVPVATAPPEPVVATNGAAEVPQGAPAPPPVPF